MSRSRVLLLTLIALIAFAANSILCRLAFERSDIDAASFTSIRLLSGALMLWLFVALRRSAHGIGGNWPSAFALFAYAAAFSFAYVSLPTGVGALLLFGAVQATMICYGLWRGERFGAWQLAGLALAVGGLVGLLVFLHGLGLLSLVAADFGRHQRDAAVADVHRFHQGFRMLSGAPHARDAHDQWHDHQLPCGDAVGQSPGIRRERRLHAVRPEGCD